MSAVAEAASVLLARGPGSPEVFIVLRAPSLRFFGGFLAFPGGRVAAADANLAAGQPGPEWMLAIRRITAARELFEETGVLLARRADGGFPEAGPTLESCRREMIEGRLPFSDLLAELGLAVEAEDFALVGGLTTPAFTPTRFDTTFFIACLPAGQRPEIWPGELDQGRWVKAADLLDEWMRGECLVSPPTLLLLEPIHGGPVAEAPVRVPPYLARHHGPGLPTIAFSPAVLMIPLHTAGLPPATHTNAYLVGEGPAYLLDPGATEEQEQQRLFDFLDRWHHADHRLTAVVLTHHHPDHIGAASACARRYGVPIAAHPETVRVLSGQINITRVIRDGERLDLGMAPDRSGPWSLEALHTPGHASGHLAFYEPHYRLLFAGDMVSMLSSVVIAPPDGDLAAYLASLQRLCEYDCRLLLPGHGSPSARPGQTLKECIAHRAQREQMLLEALGSKPRALEDLTGALYPGLPAGLIRFAQLQVRAGLEKLHAEGKAREVKTGWTASAKP